MRSAWFLVSDSAYADLEPRHAAGSVLSILTGKQDDEAYKGSDLDLFLIGLKPDEVRSDHLPATTMSPRMSC